MITALAQSGHFEDQGGSILRAQGGSVLRAHFHAAMAMNGRNGRAAAAQSHWSGRRQSRPRHTLARRRSGGGVVPCRVVIAARPPGGSGSRHQGRGPQCPSAGCRPPSGHRTSGGPRRSASSSSATRRTKLVPPSTGPVQSIPSTSNAMTSAWIPHQPLTQRLDLLQQRRFGEIHPSDDDVCHRRLLTPVPVPVSGFPSLFPASTGIVAEETKASLPVLPISRQDWNAEWH